MEQFWPNTLDTVMACSVPAGIKPGLLGDSPVQCLNQQQQGHSCLLYRNNVNVKD